MEESIHPKISVLIPVYNVEKYVGRCINSVLNQTMQEGVEVIIVNDCTPDGSIEKIFEALRVYEEKVPEERRMVVRVVNHDKNRGQAAARNTAMLYATGDYVLHVDSDDWLEINMLEELYREAIRTDADIVGCDFYYDYGDSYRKENRSFKFKPSLEYNLNSLMMCDYTANVWRRLVRRELFVEHNLSEIEGLTMGEDVIMTIQLHYYARKVAYVAKPLYNYVQNPTSLVHSISKKQIDESLRAYAVVERFLKEENIFQKYKIGFLKRCFYVKAPLILDKRVRDIHSWRAIYPESHNFLNIIVSNRYRRFFWRIFIYTPKVLAYPLLYLFDIIKSIKHLSYRKISILF